MLKLNRKLCLALAQTNVKICSSAVQRAAYSSSNSDLLHESILPTDCFQKSLPRLPIPKLEETCQRYLTSQKVLLADAEYVQTEKLVKEFEQGEGVELQAALIAHDKQNKHTSYISGPWFDMYLKDRVPLVLNYNPFMAFSHDPKPAYNDQLIRGTNFIVSSLRFMKTLRAGVLEPDVYHLNAAKSDNEKFRKFIRKIPESFTWYGAYWYKAFPLDMSQYRNLFNSTRQPRLLPSALAWYGGLWYKAFPLDMSQYSNLFSATRIPRKDRDELYTDIDAKNMLIMRNGHFYSFDVINADGTIKPATEIMAHLKYIQSDNTPAPEFPVSYLSSEDRNVWAGVREKLMEAGNADIMKAIDGAAFNLVFDDGDSEDPRELSKMFLYGDGGNRWFDKSFSVIMTKGGKAAVNFEHAWGDGVAVLRYFNEVYKDTTEKPQVHPDTVPAANVDSSAAVTRLEFKLTDEIKAAIKTAENKFNKSVSSLDLNFLQYPTFGKNFLKQQKLSPDSFMQLLIQMAYERQYGGTVPTYESCSTAAFKHGRTETIRPATAQTKKVCEMMRPGSTASMGEIRAAMEECSKVHGDLTKNAAMGKGFDRHLFGLRHMAMSKGSSLPAMFQDPAYSNINQIILSTSTLSSPAVIIGGFAPVVPNGYGIGYAIEDDNLGFVVTGYPSRNVSDFLACAQDSVNDLHKLLSGEDFRS